MAALSLTQMQEIALPIDRGPVSVTAATAEVVVAPSGERRNGQHSTGTTRQTSRRHAVGPLEGSRAETRRHPHRGLPRCEIRARASVGRERRPQVGPALAAETTPFADVGPELLRPVTLAAGLAERNRMIRA